MLDEVVVKAMHSFAETRLPHCDPATSPPSITKSIATFWTKINDQQKPI